MLRPRLPGYVQSYVQCYAQCYVQRYLRLRLRPTRSTMNMMRSHATAEQLLQGKNIGIPHITSPETRQHENDANVVRYLCRENWTHVSIPSPLLRLRASWKFSTTTHRYMVATSHTKTQCWISIWISRCVLKFRSDFWTHVKFSVGFLNAC